ncbi:hypothetical protein GXW82_15925 [Streptacidiphilus sp. 4-A2]|nr:hypothetical protein [Streptacidiphilus sp. 4-A2]
MRGRSVRLLLAAVAGAWLLPLLLDAVRLDVLLLPVLLLAVAAVIRVGGGLLDRLVVSGLLVSGALLVAGLPASVWPWRLDPVPVSGLLLSGIAAAAWAARRRPRLPWRVRGTDPLILGVGALVWHYVHRPVAGKPLADRFGYIMTVEDRVTHFSLFDTIHRVGGYAFLHQSAAAASVQSPTQSAYPQGSHFLLAWIDVFVRSDTALGSPAEAFSRYFTYILLGYAVLCALVVWAARWVGGPRLSGWQAALVCSVVAALLLKGPLALMIVQGFDSEEIGLVFLAVSMALLIRPAMGLAEYALTACAGLVTVAYVYNLYAVFVVIALLAGLLVQHRRHRGRRLLLGSALAAGVAVAVLPSVLSVLGPLDSGQQAASFGAVLPLDLGLVAGLGAVALLGPAAARNLRTGGADAGAVAAGDDGVHRRLRPLADRRTRRAALLLRQAGGGRVRHLPAGAGLGRLAAETAVPGRPPGPGPRRSRPAGRAPRPGHRRPGVAGHHGGRAAADRRPALVGSERAPEPERPGLRGLEADPALPVGAGHAEHRAGPGHQGAGGGGPGRQQCGAGADALQRLRLRELAHHLLRTGAAAPGRHRPPAQRDAARADGGTPAERGGVPLVAGPAGGGDRRLPSAPTVLVANRALAERLRRDLARDTRLRPRATVLYAPDGGRSPARPTAV